MNKDKKKISRCIHEIYVVAKNLKNKKKYKAIFGFTEKEKEYEKGLKKIDPLGEEDWSN
jgi:predicted nucleotidyltransferase